MSRSAELFLDAGRRLVALLTNDPLTSRAVAFMRAEQPVLIVSDFAAAEFASVIARRVRMGEFTSEEGRMGFSTFDAWAARATTRVHTKAADVAAAEAFLRRLDLDLRIADAINIAIAQRLDAALVTFR